MRPPRLARRLLSQLAPERDRRVILADLDDEFAEVVAPRRSRASAWAWYWGQVLRSAPSLAGSRAGHWLRDAALDIRFGARMLGRHPVFTGAALLSLSLGIGANTAIFTLIDALMLRPLAVTRPQELVSVVLSQKGRSSDHTPYPLFDALREADIFNDIAASALIGRANVSVDGGAPDAAGITAVDLVSGSYFQTLGVPAALGRTLGPADDRADAAPVVVISDAYWRRMLGADPAVLGRSMAISNLRYSIVGVADRRFSGEEVGTAVDVWAPIARQSDVMTERPGLLTHPTSNWLRVIARMRPEMTTAAASAAAVTVFRRTTTDPLRQDVEVSLVPAGKGFSRGREFLETPFLVLMAAVGVVLLIACANVAMLLIARSTSRGREMAVRLALGASRGRLLRQMLAENATLALAAGALGIVIAVWGAGAFASAEAAGRLGLELDTRLDVRVLAVTGALTVATLLLVGVLPAFSVLRGPRAVSAGARTGGALVVAQLALSLALMVGAGLLGRTLSNLETQDAGFDRDNVWLFWLAPSEAGRQGASLAPLFDDAVSAASAVPGVARAAVSTDGVLSGFVGLRAVRPEGGTLPDSEADINAQWNLVGPGFFDAIGMRLIAGRDFGAADTAAAPPVAVVNQAMARYFFGTDAVVGRRFSFGREALQRIEIVGVVKDATYYSPREQDSRMVFLPYRQDASHLFRMCVVVRTAGPPAGTIERVRAALRQAAPSVPLLRVDSARGQYDRSLSSERLTAWLGGGFGALAVLLTSIGLYGVSAFTVTRRTREIGIRMALGASRSSVLRRELAESCRLLGLGLAAGVPLAWYTARAIGALLFGVTPADPWTIAAAASVLAIVSLAAGFVPARRASLVDPIVTLRVEDTSGGSHA